MGYVNEVRRGYFVDVRVSGGKEYLPRRETAGG